MSIKKEFVHYPLWAACMPDGECLFFDTEVELRCNVECGDFKVRRARRVPASEWIGRYMDREQVNDRIVEIIGEELEFIIKLSGPCIKEMPDEKYSKMVAEVERVMARHLDPYVKAWELEPPRGTR